MDLLELCAAYSAWPKLKRPLELLSRWDCPRGLLLCAHDGSADELAAALVRCVGGFEIALRPREIRREEWRHDIERYLRKAMLPDGVIQQEGKARICLVVHDLEKHSHWLVDSIKGLMESDPARPFCCIATTTDEGAIEPSIASMFSAVRKTGRPRDDS